MMKNKAKYAGRCLCHYGKLFSCVFILFFSCHPIQAIEPVEVSPVVRSEFLKEIRGMAFSQFNSDNLKIYPAQDMLGVYEATVGSYVFQISDDATLSLRGDLFYTEHGELLTRQQKALVRREALNLLNEDDMIVYPSKTQQRYLLTVFIDVECEFCAKLHADLPRITQAGVKVRFLAFPRAGIDSHNYKKTVAIWCADDRITALERIQRRLSIPDLQCASPVTAHFYLGESFLVDGTPTLVFEDGVMQPGYPGFDYLLNALAQHQLQTHKTP